MGAEHIKFDIHHWNLDWFKPARPKAPGKESLSIVFNDGRGPLKRVALLEYQGGGAAALLLRSKARAVDKTDPRSPKAPALFKDVSNREIVDIAVHGRDLYLLDRKNQRIECFPYDPEEDEPAPRGEPKSKKDKRKQRQEERKQRKEEPRPRFWSVSDAGSSSPANGRATRRRPLTSAARAAAGSSTSASATPRSFTRSRCACPRGRRRWAMRFTCASTHLPGRCSSPTRRTTASSK